MAKGYLNTFLSEKIIELPKVAPDHQFLIDNIKLDYTHFSILFSKNRRQAICTAVNIDGKEFRVIKRKEKSDKWIFEELINKTEQLGKEFYSITNTYFHKGHIVRRLDPAWGLEEEAKKAEEDTFHYTNASPQHKQFNTDIWLELERNILERGAVACDKKITVFAGPVLSKKDKPYVKTVKDEYIFIPSIFWKIVVWKKNDGKIYAVGFMQSQRDLIDNLVDLNYGRKEKQKMIDDEYFESITFKNNAVYQVNITDIEKITGLQFDFNDVSFPKIKNVSKVSEIKKAVEQFPTSDQKRYRDRVKTVPSLEGLVLE